VKKQLTWASVALLATIVLHTLDHVRQGRSVEPLVGAIGVVGNVAAITVVALAIRRSRLTAPAAVVVGFATFLGFIAIHLVPDWGPLADGYPGLGVDALSWVAVAIPMAAALWLGLAGLAQLRAQRHAAANA
jgi:hypothetical protein